MTDFEMMQAIFDEIKGINSRLDNIEKDNQAIKQELKEVKQDVQVVSARFDSLEKEVKLNTVAIESTAAQYLKAYNDGYIANRDKINSFNYENIL